MHLNKYGEAEATAGMSPSLDTTIIGQMKYLLATLPPAP